MSDSKTNEEIKNQEFKDLVWDKEYFKALDFFKTNKNDVIFDKMEVEHLAEGMHKVGYYQESYDLHEMLFRNEPHQLTLNFYERLNESWIKINDMDYEKYCECFYGNYMGETPREIIKYCPKCGNKLAEVIYGYIDVGEDGLGEDYVLGGCIVDDFNVLRICKKCGAEFNKYDLYGPNLEKVGSEILTREESTEINIIFVELKRMESHGSLPIHLLNYYFKNEFGINDFEKIIGKLEHAEYVFRPIKDYIKLIDINID